MVVAHESSGVYGGFTGDVAVGAACMSQAAPLPGPRVEALGCVSGVLSEGGVKVLTVGLGTHC